jgi:hypothetical protein
MPETTLYFELISAARALLVDEEQALEGATTISLETQPELAEDDVFTFVHDNFEKFLRALRFLKKEDQELLLSYYLLSKTQNTLALIHRSTQTVCSFRIRMAVKTLGTFMMMGTPTRETLHETFEKAGHENLLTTPLSTLVMDYVECRDFRVVAERYGLHRPDIRRSIRVW